MRGLDVLLETSREAGSSTVVPQEVQEVAQKNPKAAERRGEQEEF